MSKKIKKLLEYIGKKDEDAAKKQLKDVLKEKVRQRLLSELEDIN